MGLLSSLASGLGGGYSYDALSSKYQGFSLPQAEIELNKKVFGEKTSKVLVDEINVENTSGFESSVARFRIYNVYDVKTGEFAYESLKKSVFLGAPMTIKLGYVDTLTPVFVGFVTAVNFAFEPDDLPYIEVTGMDVKAIMMSGNYAKQLTAKSYSAAVKEILDKTAYSNLKTGGGISNISVTDTPDAMNQKAGASAETIEMVSESDYEFVVKAAKKFNYEFFVDGGTVYFRKAKSDTTPIMELGVGSGILKFNIGYSLSGIVETIEARTMDPGTGKIITKKQKVTNNLSTSGKAKGLVAKSEKIFIDPSISSQQQADARVAYLVENMSYRLGSLDCECIGMPELSPGKFVTLSGFGTPVDNDFYLTTVIHSFRSDAGYRTKLIGKAAEVKK
jgi:phage protein D